jgi:hypothetical protein
MSMQLNPAFLVDADWKIATRNFGAVVSPATTGLFQSKDRNKMHSPNRIIKSIARRHLVWYEPKR